jgi:hypothetical protein|tara:strand:+ start:463 stop:858 length:396 start_codon:yes stop_codon:yes gene_type:complete
MGYNPKFDIDLDFGEVHERGLKNLFEKTGGKIEVKTERGKWYETGNIAIEIRCRGKKSGLSVTEADWWFHILSIDGKVKGMLVFTVKELKKIVKGMEREGSINKVMGGDDNQSEILLLPIGESAESIGKFF